MYKPALGFVNIKAVISYLFLLVSSLEFYHCKNFDKLSRRDFALVVEGIALGLLIILQKDELKLFL